MFGAKDDGSNDIKSSKDFDSKKDTKEDKKKKKKKKRELEESNTSVREESNITPKKVEGEPEFIKSKKFKGTQKGYIFKRDKNGLGYYKDTFYKKVKKGKLPKADAPPKFIPSPKFKGATKGYVYKLDKKGLGYYKDKKPKVSSKSGFNRSTWTPGDDKKKKKKKKKKDRHKGHSSGGKMRWDTY